MSESEKFVKMNYAAIEKQIMEARVARSVYLGSLIADFLLTSARWAKLLWQAVMDSKKVPTDKNYRMFDA